MLGWLWIGLGVLTAWALASWLDRRALAVMIAEHREKWPNRCPVCSIQEAAARHGSELRPIRHRCIERPGEGDVVPAGRNEVVPVEES